MKVFVTDASYKQTLAAVRSLGRKDIGVICGSSYRLAQTFFSRYCGRKVIYPNPADEDRFIKFMLKYVQDNKIDVLLPVGYLASTALSKHKEEFGKYVKLPVADYEAMQVACNKDRTLEFADVLGIGIPKTYGNIEEIDNYPVVVKGIRESGRLRYVNSPETLSGVDISDAVVQEYIPGEGYGLYALYNDGEPRAVFMHKRIREYPVTGGASTAAESVYDSELREQGLKLLGALKWHGVAMVEFKKDSRDGRFKLMEINPKFWGSLDLSIASGVDFPYLTVMMAVRGDIEPVTDYRCGIRFRWPFPDDFLHLLARPGAIGAFVADFFRKGVRSNFSISDVKPNLIQMAATVRAVVRRLFKGKLRHPHGVPKVRR